MGGLTEEHLNKTLVLICLKGTLKLIYWSYSLWNSVIPPEKHEVAKHSEWMTIYIYFDLLIGRYSYHICCSVKCKLSDLYPKKTALKCKNVSFGAFF